MADEASPRTRPARPSDRTHFVPAEQLEILLIDDDEAVRVVLSRFLGSRGFHVQSVASGPAALELLARSRFSLAICDVYMPEMSGVDVVRQALRLDPELAIIMLTGANDAGTATQALSGGAIDYLMKPIGLPVLEHAIGRALHRRRLLVEQRRIDHMIREEVDQQTDQLRTMSVSVVETLVNAMEAKSIYLRGHSQRTAALGAAIADSLELPTETIEHVRLAGRLHDVGEIGVRESVLNKPSGLTEEEYDEVKSHVRIGMEILSPLSHLGPVLEFVQDHHEHWDGGGYPRRLAGKRISIGGRILAAADAFDSLTSQRAYRDPVSSAEALDILAATVGTLLERAVFDALGRVVVRGQTLTFIDDVHG